MRETDVIVIGAGSTGWNVADRVVKGGLSAVVVEAELVGGDCAYWACMPSKALLRPAQAVSEVRAVDGARQALRGDVDVRAVLARRDRFTSQWNDAEEAEALVAGGIELIRGRARLIGERRVEVRNGAKEPTEIRARHAVAICTGSRAVVPPVPGLAEIHPWTSRDATSAHEAPRRLAILGGGVVACEMATAWGRLGTEEITILQRAPRLIHGHEPFASEALAEGLRARGVRVLTGTTAARVSRNGGGAVDVLLDSGETIRVDQILVAAGREPRTRELGLEAVGLEPGAWLAVDDAMRVRSVAGGWLYAAGDVNRRALLTHMGKYQARVCGDGIVARARGEAGADQPAAWSRLAASADRAAVPQVIFTEPEVAAVGLTEEEARAQGLSVRAVEYDIGRVSGASLYADGYAGRAKMVVDADRRVIVGMTLVGPGVGELIHAATIAVVGAVPLERLWHAVPAYPTMSEIWLRLLEAFGL